MTTSAIIAVSATDFFAIGSSHKKISKLSYLTIKKKRSESHETLTVFLDYSGPEIGKGFAINAKNATEFIIIHQYKILKRDILSE